MECNVAFEVVFDVLKEKIQTLYKFELNNPRRTLPKLNKQSSTGAKIKYYRRLNNITQEELAKRLGVSREVILNIENGNRKGGNAFINPKIINQIIDILEMRDKFGKSDTYIRFVCEDTGKSFSEFRTKHGLSVKQFARLLKVSDTSIRRYEKNENTPSYTIFSRYKKIRDSLE